MNAHTFIVLENNFRNQNWCAASYGHTPSLKHFQQKQKNACWEKQNLFKIITEEIICYKYKENFVILQLIGIIFTYKR